MVLNFLLSPVRFPVTLQFQFYNNIQFLIFYIRVNLLVFDSVLMETTETGSVLGHVHHHVEGVAISGKPKQKTTVSVWVHLQYFEYQLDWNLKKRALHHHCWVLGIISYYGYFQFIGWRFLCINFSMIVLTQYSFWFAVQCWRC